MQIDQLATLLSSELFAKLAWVIGVGLVLILFWWRAGSLFCIFERLWRLVLGRAAVDHPQLADLIQEKRDIEKLRFLLGVRATSRAEIEKLKMWLDQHSIGIGDIRDVERWIDLKTDEVLAPPSRRELWGVGVAWVLFVGFLFCALYVSFLPSGLLQIRATDTWFWLDQQSVQRVHVGPFGQSWQPVALANCKAGSQALQQGGFSDADAGTICKGYGDGELGKFLVRTLKEQLAIGVFCSTLFSIGFATLFREWLKIIRARALKHRLTKQPRQSEQEVGVASLPTETPLSARAAR